MWASASRLIPAGAGNIRGCVLGACHERAHPRGCGEHVISLLAICWFLGSSPRVRGTSCVSAFSCGCAGLIPAGAGNITPSEAPKNRPRAHPRGCGEHEENSGGGGKTAGSSPRVRGTCKVIILETDPSGLIPAGAGNMFGLVSMMPLIRAHPRGCGEHKIIINVYGIQEGSSPRVRGTS